MNILGLFENGVWLTLFQGGLTWWLQSAALLAIGLTAAAIAKSRGAAAQSAIYRATLLAVLACPLLSFALSYAGISLLTIDLQTQFALDESFQNSPSPALAGTMESGHDLSFEAGNQLAAETAAANTAGQPTTPLQYESEPFAATASERRELPIEAGMLKTEISDNSFLEKSAATTFASPFRIAWIALLSIWGVGMAGMLLRLVSEAIRSRRLWRSSGSAEDSAVTVCRQVADRLGVCAPMIRVSPFLNSPCLYGHWRPTVFLPEDTPSNSYFEVFLHELAHLRRADWLWTLCGRVTLAMLWHQPLMWRLTKRMSESAEEVCDDYVLQHGGNREGYLQRLVQIAENRLTDRVSIGVSMVSFRSSLGQRAKRILDSTRVISTSVGHRFVCSAVLAMATVTALIGLVYVGGPATVIAQDEISTSDRDETAIEESEPVKKLLTGTVQGPDGQPIAGATVLLEDNLYDEDKGQYRHTIAETTTGSQGNFAMDVSEHKYVSNFQLVATAPGFGIGFDPIQDQDLNRSLKLPEDLAIEGRVINTEGQPVVGVDVSVVSTAFPKSDDEVDRWVDERLKKPLKLDVNDAMAFNDPAIRKTRYPSHGAVLVGSTILPKSVSSDAEGKFRMDGIGKNRKAILRFNGASIAQDHATVVVREMKPLHADNPRPTDISPISTLHRGNVLNVVAQPSQQIIGNVVDDQSGTPFRDAKVIVSHISGTKLGSRRGFLRTRTDDQGNYTIAGLPLGGGHTLQFIPEPDEPYFETSRETAKTKAVTPIACDFRLKKAIWISGQVTDQDGNPVTAIVQYYPFRTNEFAKEYPNFDPVITGKVPDDRIKTDENGRFKIRAIPGPGVLGAHVHFGNSNHERVKAGVFLSQHSNELLESVGGERMPRLFNPWSAKWYNTLREIELSPDQTEVHIDLSVVKGQTHALSVVDSESRPVKAFQIMGRVFPPRLESMPSSVAELVGLDSQSKRLVAIFDEDKKRGITFVFDTQNRPKQVKLQPCASIQGRVVDEDGQPVENVQFHVTPKFDQDNWSRRLTSVTTKADGVFDILVPPGHPYRIWAYTSKGPNIEFKVNPQPGKNYFVGDVRDGEKREEATMDKLAVGNRNVDSSSRILVTKEFDGDSVTTKNATFTYSGLVIDANGKPAVGSDIYHLTFGPSLVDRKPLQPVAKTDAKGTFRFESNLTFDATHRSNLIVVKHPRHALEWVTALTMEESGRLLAEAQEKTWYAPIQTLLDRHAGPIQLRRDDVTVRGRIVDLEGNGISGAAVSIKQISTGVDGTLRDWERVASRAGANLPSISNATIDRLMLLDSWSLFPEIRTNDKGEFTISGIGKGRIAKLVVHGKNMETLLAYARTNNGPRRVIGIGAETRDYWAHRFYGTSFSLVAPPAKPIVGKITDAETGQPVAGVMLTSEESYSLDRVGNKTLFTRKGNDEVTTTSDRDGKYRLDGLPSAAGVSMILSLPGKRYLRREIKVDTRGVGVAPIRKDISLQRGRLVRGTIVDEKTDRGIAGRFTFLPAPSKKRRSAPFHVERGADATGQFQIVIPRGNGTLCFETNRAVYPMVKTPNSQTRGLDPFAPGRRYHLVHPVTQGDSPLSVSWSLAPWPTTSGKAIAEDGSVLQNVLYVGRSGQFPRFRPSQDGALTLIGLQKGKPRRVVALHQKQRLTGMLTLHGDEADFTVKTQPWATVTGRLVDEDGQPLAGIRLHNGSIKRRPMSSPKMRGTPFEHPIPLPPTDEIGNTSHHTDQEGRFELVGLIPGHSYHLYALLGQNMLHIDPTIADQLTLKSGESRDLGDVVLKEFAKK